MGRICYNREAIFAFCNRWLRICKPQLVVFIRLMRYADAITNRRNAL